ncbi:hypothetical protein GN109_12305 [Collimonas pratensis]|uniref:glycosyltransferase family 39 protein n=1 Tax=Collimonas pratensis TaxID=279113 RepID=UPI00143D3F65|nr:glycosyltransferase family 39 protein [Collimonas pratensis]NKI70206.1 hypothetical protein [Collimonas pratensis]
MEKVFETPHIKNMIKPNRITQLFIGALFIHVILWTLLPTILYSNVSLDMVEGLAWGHEWQLGYEKDPPLFPWAIEFLTKWSNKELWISYLAGQLCIGAVFFAVWKLGRRITTEINALVGVLLLEGVYYFNFPTPEFNDIVLQMPFAALFGWLLHKAIIENRLFDWILCGLSASLGLWSRYSMGAYILPLAIFMVAHPIARRRFTSCGPWVLALAITLPFLPHLYWIVQSDFVSIEYVGRRAPHMTKISDFIESLISFLVAQFLAMLPMLLMAITLWRWKITRPHLQMAWVNFDRAYLMTLAFGPLFFSLLLSITTVRPLRTMWGAPLWCFVGLFAVTTIRPMFTLARSRHFGYVWGAALLLPTIIFILEQCYAPHFTGNEKRTRFPGDQLAKIVAERWHASFDSPLKYVVGDTWHAGNVAFYADERPSAMFSHGAYRFSPWIDPSDMKRFGAVVVWDAMRYGDLVPSEITALFAHAIPQPPVILNSNQSEYRIGFAYILPERAEKLIDVVLGSVNI